MESGSFVGTTPCPQAVGFLGSGPIKCTQPCNVYDQGSGAYTSICSGSTGMHQQFFGSYYLDLVVTGSGPAW